MSSDLLKVGDVQAHWNAAGNRILKYSVEIFHEGLKEHKLISAPETFILENKADLQANKWEEKWEALEEKRHITEQKEANLDEAEQRTAAAQEELSHIENLLKHTLSIDDAVDWDSVKKKEKFAIVKPTKPSAKKHIELPEKPIKSDERFRPKLTLIDKIIKSKKEKKIEDCNKYYEGEVKGWEEKCNDVKKQNSEIDKTNAAVNDDWNTEVANWENTKKEFYKSQEIYNNKIEELKANYLTKDSSAVTEYCEIVLNNSEYPDSFPKNFELEFNSENNILIVEYDLPAQDIFPNVKEVKYIASRKELKESYISEVQLNKMYDSAIYQIALRTIHELFEADVVDALSAISFNGWVNSINKATGKHENNCILSIQSKKDAFIEIDLEHVEPKACFKSLKGVASSKLASLTPIQPILQISKSDKRIVEGYDVAHTLDNSTNIAAMDWGDFEHLIRELFEKEFMVNGGEVKVTQASRDGGVDAIAFDPDPIRGGKIVIQAKRYTNTVGVSAVRDLFGTVMNEGATKGILVSTADYGPDAYEFANGKPITLLNGSNLLHLLEKHGHHAKIDLKEAKKLLKEE